MSTDRVTRVVAAVEDHSALLFALIAVASSALLLALGSGFTFFFDEWDVLLHRPGWSADALLSPNFQHPSLVPVGVFKLLQETFGMESAAPYRVVATLVLVLTAALVFAFVRDRVGGWFALWAAALILIFGPGWYDLFSPWQMSLLGSMCAGIGALLMLDREDRTGDRLACLLLVAAVCCSGLGLAFAAGALVDVLLRPRGWSRLYIAAVPSVLFGVWYAAYGHTGASTLSLDNLVDAPRYLLDGVAAALASLVGLGATTVLDPSAEALKAGRPLLVVAIAALVSWWVLRGVRPARPALVALATMATFWLLTAANEVPGREAHTSRYVLFGAIFVILVGAELFRGRRIAHAARLVVGAVALFALVSNLAPLRAGADYFREQSLAARASLTMIELTRDQVEPDYVLLPEATLTHTLAIVDAASYLAARDAFGSPAFSVDELRESSDGAREIADRVLAQIREIRMTSPAATRRPSGARCVSLAPSVEGSTLRLRPGRVTISARDSSVQIYLRRFATESFPISPGTVPEHGAGRIEIPRDSSPQAWELQAIAEREVTLCGPAVGRGSAVRNGDRL